MRNVILKNITDKGDELANPYNIKINKNDESYK